MKKFLIAVIMLASTLSMTMHDADAKRLGGGGSVGRQSTNVSRQATQPAGMNNTNQARPAAAPQPAVQPAPVPCLLYTSPSPRDISGSRMPSSA